MKRILFILLSVFFLQTTMCISAGTSAANAAEISISALANDLNASSSDEERTEDNFYGFIRYNVIGKDNPIPKGKLHYAKFSTANEVYNEIINLIIPASERTKFNKTELDKTKKYDSNMMTVEYREDTKDGIAELTVKFKKRKDLKQCTVVFKSRR